MHIGEFSFPLYLNKKNIVKQIETIGLAFNRYSGNSVVKIRSYKCCCIALDKTKIISIGVNKAKTNPNYLDYVENSKMTIHAEIDMIMNIERAEDFKKVSDIYIIRGYSQLLPSFPCSLCSGYLYKKFRDRTRLHFYTGEKWDETEIESLAENI